MEIINENKPPLPKKKDIRKNSANGNLYLGGVLILVGIFWLLKNYDVIGYGFYNFIFSWPMLLVTIGGYLLVIRKITAGIIVGAIGGLLLLSGFVHLKEVVMPICVIAIGLAIILSVRDKNKK